MLGNIQKEIEILLELKTNGNKYYKKQSNNKKWENQVVDGVAVLKGIDACVVHHFFKTIFISYYSARESMKSVS